MIEMDYTSNEVLGSEVMREFVKEWTTTPQTKGVKILWFGNLFRTYNGKSHWARAAHARAAFRNHLERQTELMYALHKDFRTPNPLYANEHEELKDWALYPNSEEITEFVRQHEAKGFIQYIEIK